MQKKSSPQKFKKSNLEKLQDIWYKKLKGSGFHDIESPQAPGGLKRYSWLSPYNRQETYRSAKEEYYRYAERFIDEHEFSSRKEKNIWAYHANGISCRNIVDLLKKVRIKTDRDFVNKTIMSLREKMFDLYGIHT